jgi:glycerol uptake facilitator-like aquaporin
VLAQLAGSVAGTGLARLLWGHAALSLVGYGAVRPATAWQPESVFVAEAGSLTLLILVVGFFLARRGHARLLPQVIGLFVGLVIAFLGPLSGGSINPAVSSVLPRFPVIRPVCGSIWSRLSWERFSGPRSTACSSGRPARVSML